MPGINTKAVGQPLSSMEFDYTDKDVILYALSLGCNAGDLPFTYEKDLRVVPSFAVVPAYLVSKSSAGILQYNPLMVLHGEQSVEFHRPIPASGRLTTTGVVEAIYDKAKGASVVLKTETFDTDKQKIFTNLFNIYVRNAGGFGGTSGPKEKAREMPQRAPDHKVEIRTSPDQALLYRLNGDRNPLHADPEFARRAGFEQPILHGLCTFGIACRALLSACCDNDPARLKAQKGRFSSVVFPGETLVTEIWQVAEGEVLFQTRVKERDVIALSRASARIS